MSLNLNISKSIDTQDYDRYMRVLRQVMSHNIELEAMKAENKQREIRGESLAYTEKDFLDLKESFLKSTM